jgi:predicted nuclease of restriction endonuclease-like (RecB) superfamily
MNDNLSDNKSTVYESIRTEISAARTTVYNTINSAMVNVYWNIGKQISEEIGDRVEYGKGLLSFLADKLTTEFGKGYSIRNLQMMRKFFLTFPNTNTLCSQLSWSHYRLLMRIDDQTRRLFYENECASSNWTVRQLERQINSFFYERMIATQESGKSSVANEIFNLEPNKDPKYIIKDPYILEFLDLKEKKDYLESDLEQELINKLEEFMLELGKGFSFVKRQMRITTDHGSHFYIDLVFYNYILKCFVIIDLKTGELTYQDIGQIDFYVRLFDDSIKQSDDNPTIGIVLCADKDETIVKYSVLADNDKLFASKYKPFLPTEEELKREIMRELSETDFNNFNQKTD